MTRKTKADIEQEAYAEEPEEVIEPLNTVSFTITVGDKVISVKGVPTEQNSTYLQAQIISMFSLVGEGSYDFNGATVEVTKKE